jgi:hypothetical protein
MAMSTTELPDLLGQALTLLDIWNPSAADHIAALVRAEDQAGVNRGRRLPVQTPMLRRPERARDLKLMYAAVRSG